MRPSRYFVGPNLALEAIWVWDPWSKSTRDWLKYGWQIKSRQQSKISCSLFYIRLGTRSKRLFRLFSAEADNCLRLPRLQLVSPSMHSLACFDCSTFFHVTLPPPLPRHEVTQQRRKNRVLACTTFPPSELGNSSIYRFYFIGTIL